MLQGIAEKAKEMYAANPRLLFIEASAQDYAAGIDENDYAVYRTIVASPYRAALGAGDVGILKDMAHYFDQVIDKVSGKTGHQLAVEQLIEQFPNGIDYPPSTYDFSKLVNDYQMNKMFILIGENQMRKQKQYWRNLEKILCQALLESVNILI